MSPVPQQKGRTIQWPDNPHSMPQYSRLSVAEIDTTRLIVDLYETIHAQNSWNLMTGLFILCVGFALGILVFASVHDLVLHVNGCYGRERESTTSETRSCEHQHHLHGEKESVEQALALVSVNTIDEKRGDTLDEEELVVLTIGRDGL
ncbi:hypothetical protein BCR39DRAFT_233931 [Naematelia encephala]|uniref:Copper transporter n=1 Tax=Naematelia encephala TaxID=71784 RepID=A0A1Y2BH12_9TREE|nr:hypothetical protein BCR39DRAFT_233931 [Naematelia encephala]